MSEQQTPSETLRANAMLAELEAQRTVLGTRAAHIAGDREILAAQVKSLTERVAELEAELAKARKKAKKQEEEHKEGG